MNTSAPQVKEVEPMEDIQDSARGEEVRINTAKLDEKLRELINNCAPSYTLKLFALRPQDHKLSALPNNLKHVHKRRAIVVGNNGTCAGQHLHESLQQVIAKDNVHPRAITGSYLGPKLNVILDEPPANEYKRNTSQSQLTLTTLWPERVGHYPC
ncbi:hypothetical protein GQ44DRAFT_494874 [Phaeosphaeriaceae sp. PMI808]|nr:hypothetical protein GQ44DRAFT_494874 [Phaeosphaeriaceae sp. PMI808]